MVQKTIYSKWNTWLQFGTEANWPYKIIKNSLCMDWYIGQYFTEGFESLLKKQLGPVGRVGLEVAKSVWWSVVVVICVFVPFPWDFFRGCSLALWSHDHFEASYWSTLPQLKIKKSRNLFKFVLFLLSASVERVGVSCMRDFLNQYLFR